VQFLGAGSTALPRLWRDDGEAEPPVVAWWTAVGEMSEAHETVSDEELSEDAPLHDPSDGEREADE
jgi:hypothetical protein